MAHINQKLETHHRIHNLISHKKAIPGKHRGHRALIALQHHLHAHEHYNIEEIQPSNSYSNILGGSIVRHVQHFKPGQLSGCLKNITLRLTIKCLTSSIELINPFLWIDHIDFNILGKEKIQTIYGEQLLYYFLMLSDEEREALSRLIGIQPSGWISKNGAELATNEEKTYYIPLFGAFYQATNLFDLNLQELNNSLEMVVYWRATPIVAGTGTISIQNLTFMIHSLDEHEKQKLIKKDIMQSHGLVQWNYLDTIRITEELTVSSISGSITLNMQETDNKKLAFLTLLITSGDFTTNSQTILRFRALGNSLVDYRTSSGDSIISSGQGIRADYLKNYVWPEMFNTELPKGCFIYCIPLSDNIRNAINGQMNDGYYHQEHSNYQLNITFGTAATGQVHTITLANTNTTGYYKLEYDGRSSKYMAYNETAANIKTEIDDELFKWKYGSPSTTLSGPLSSTATVTISDNAELGNEKPIYMIPHQMDDGTTVEHPDSDITTKEIIGPVTGTYDIWVYAHYFRRFHFSLKNWSVEDL